MKKMIRQIRRFLVVAYANYIYKQKVRLADKLHARHNTRFYVALNGDGKSLFVLSRKGFRHILRQLSDRDNRNERSERKNRNMQSKRSEQKSILALKAGAFYYTPDASGTDPLPVRECELRRLAFIRLILDRSRMR